MKDSDLSTPEHLEAGLVLSRALKHERLWRAAEGRSGRLEVIGVLAAAILVAVGLIQYGRAVGFADLMSHGVLFIVAGLVMLISYQSSSALRQRSALLEIIKRLEQDRS